MFKKYRYVCAVIVALLLSSFNVTAQAPAVTDPPQFGPYNATFLPDAGGLIKPISDPRDHILSANAPWSLSCWINTAEPVDALEIVAGFGRPATGGARYLAIDRGRLALLTSDTNQIAGAAILTRTNGTSSARPSTAPICTSLPTGNLPPLPNLV
jgi:hypothetical protein